MSTRTAREVVELYNLVVWNQRDYTLAEELIGATVTRHGVDHVTVLTHEQAVQRVRDSCAGVERIHFELPLVLAADDGEHVTITYECAMTAKDGTETTIGSMEIFRVVEGRITEVYNCGGGSGTWR